MMHATRRLPGGVLARTHRHGTTVALAMAAGILGLALPVASARAADTFTIAITPDTQGETLSDPARFNNRMQWLADNKDARNIAIMLHVGDMMNWDTPDHFQYVNGSAGIDILDAAGMPYALAIGNHDTAAVKEGGSAAPGDVNANLRNTSTFNAYFPTTRHTNLVSTQEAGKIDNACHAFTAGGLDWLAINLELWPRAFAVDWAKTVVAGHPNHNVIIVTHCYLNWDSTIGTSNGGYGDNSPMYVYDNLVKQYANIRMVFSGHTGSHGYRTDTGVHGNTIYSFLQCYHDGATNPVRLLEVNTANGSMASTVYCPLTDQYKNDGSTFTVSGVSWVPATSTPPPPPPQPPAPGPGTGILRETWLGIDGGSLAELSADARFPTSPDTSEVIASFEGPADAGDSYGSRLRGYLIPPLTGEYVFWIAGDNESRLLLNAGGENPAGAAQICSVPGWTAPHEWTKYTEQQSAPVTLTAGARYYVEALHKEGTGGDNISVRWLLPGGATETPIPGNRLDPCAATQPRAPYLGAAHAIPGSIEAEDYDVGGEGVSYHDSTPQNDGGAYRTDGVDLQASTGGGHNVGWTAGGEWLEYSVSVAAAGTYDIAVRVASESAGGTVRVSCDGVDLTGPAAFGATGGWQTWSTAALGSASLPAGAHVLRLTIESGGFNLDRIDVVASGAGLPDTDADDDGLPDDWELAQFGDLDQDASGDPDDDLFTNLEEFLSGSDPNDEFSVPDTSSATFSCAADRDAGAPHGLLIIGLVLALYARRARFSLRTAARTVS